MAKSIQELRTTVVLLITLGLWLIAMFTPGWIMTSFAITNTSQTVSADLQLSLFYIKICSSGICVTATYEDLSRLHSYNGQTLHSTPTNLLPAQVKSVLAVALCGLCCILLILPDSRSHKKMSIASGVIIFSAVAVCLECLVVFLMFLANLKLHESMPTTTQTLKAMYPNVNIKMELNFPYSIFIAGVGLIFGIMGIVLAWRLRLSLKETTWNQLFDREIEVDPPNRLNILPETDYK